MKLISPMAKRHNNGRDDETWFQILLGFLAILAMKSLFEHDNSKIISQKGVNILSDEKKMDEIGKKLEALEKEKNNSQNEILI